jgi:beta-barrel assembly-enhancing protease
LQLSAIAAGQTVIQPPENRYSVRDDINIGRQAAREIEKQLPLLSERGGVDNYVEILGRRLSRAIPPRHRHRGFVYRFDVVNVRDVNAFALPGGPLYINRGLIQTASNEGELAGVMAHELAHIALRHGTAQATEAQSLRFQLPSLGGAILGAIIGGTTGGIVSQSTQLGVGIYFLKYKREYEEQADVLGAQIVARAGYDPRDLANMFRKIEQVSDGGGPEFLSSHPDPGDRHDRIVLEASLQGATGRRRHDSSQFRRARSSLLAMSPAPSMRQVMGSS